MTKQPRFVSKLRLSKLCRWILILGAFKLCLLVSLVLMPTDAPQSAEGLIGSAPARAASPFSTEQATPTQQGMAATGSTAGAATGATPGQFAQSAPSGQMSGQMSGQPSGQAAGQLFGQSSGSGARGNTLNGAPPSTVPPAPRIAPGQTSPFAQSMPEYTRPDEAVPPAPPSPNVTPLAPRDSVARKQEELNRREQELLALQQQMQSRLDELKKIEGNVQTMLKQADNSQDDKLRHLVDVYSNMKARQAAEVLTNLDERIAVQILTGMRGRQAGEILTYMNPEKAAKLSEALTRTQLPR